MSTQLRTQPDLSPAVELDSGGSVEVGDGLVVDAPRGGPGRTPPLRLTSGRRAAFRQREGDDILTVTAADGRVELSVRFTPDGPVLSFDSAGLRLESPGTVTFSCERFQVEAREAVALHSAGAIEAAAEGGTVVQAGGPLRVEGHAVEVRSRRGNVDVSANDDLRLRGERIKLNC
jgi:uncharacterized Zn finger protein